jgi:hypothetical protein
MATPVSAETIEKAARAIAATRWSDLDWEYVVEHSTPDPFRDEARAAIVAVRDDVVSEALAPVRDALDRLDAMNARSDEAKWGAGRAVAVIRAALLDRELAPMRIEVRGSCGVSSALGSQWRNSGHWHTVWPEGEHWCFPTEAEAVERAIEVRDIWIEHPHLAPVQATEPEPVVTVRMLHRTPNHVKGQLGTLHDASPSGHVNERLKWVDYGEPIEWSHGRSESTGEWCGPGEYEVVQAVEEVGDRG